MNTLFRRSTIVEIPISDTHRSSRTVKSIVVEKLRRRISDGAKRNYPTAHFIVAVIDQVLRSELREHAPLASNHLFHNLAIKFLANSAPGKGSFIVTPWETRGEMGNSPRGENHHTLMAWVLVDDFPQRLADAVTSPRADDRRMSSIDEEGYNGNVCLGQDTVENLAVRVGSQFLLRK